MSTGIFFVYIWVCAIYNSNISLAKKSLQIVYYVVPISCLTCIQNTSLYLKLLFSINPFNEMVEEQHQQPLINVITSLIVTCDSIVSIQIVNNYKK